MVSNSEVVRTLERIADLPEIRAENRLRGCALPEYGVFRLDDGARVAGETEHDVDAARGLDWIPPQCRDDATRIESTKGAVAASVEV